MNITDNTTSTGQLEPIVLRVRCPRCTRIMAARYFSQTKRTGRIGQDKCNPCKDSTNGQTR